MIVSDFQLGELKHSNQTLNVPFDASAHQIKQSYRRLLKRWHPDLYPNGTPAQAEATRMAELINEAYLSIGNAPLRYYIGSPAALNKDYCQRSSESPAEGGLDEEYAILLASRIEFCVRFVCGILFGILLCLDLAFIVLGQRPFQRPVPDAGMHGNHRGVRLRFGTVWRQILGLDTSPLVAEALYRPPAFCATRHVTIKNCVKAQFYSV